MFARCPTYGLRSPRILSDLYHFLYSSSEVSTVNGRFPIVALDPSDLSESQELTLHVFPPAVQVRETILLTGARDGTPVGLH